MHEQQASAASVQKVLARVRAVQNSRVHRDLSGRFWIEGIRQFVQACEGRWKFDTVICSRTLLKSDLADELRRRLRSSGVPVVAVTPEQFRSIQLDQRASGIGAIVRQRWTPLHSLDLSRGLGWVIIETLRSPGNLGTILRTAEASGMAGVIFLGKSCDLFDWRVVRSSMGGIFHLQLARTTADRLRHWASSNNVRIIGLSPQASKPWSQLAIDGKVALWLGEERRGLPDAARKLCDLEVSLPMAGRADSLNVAVAAGVMMYELVRRRSERDHPA